MMDKIKAPFEKIGSAVYDRGSKLSNARTGVEVSAVIILIIVLAVL
jgi:hypothetical protein